MAFVVLGFIAATFGYMTYHAETVPIEACCPTLKACNWAASECACNATIMGGRYTMELLPKANPLCPNKTSHEARRPGRRGSGAAEGGDHKPTCLDQHDCDVTPHAVPTTA